MIRLAYKFPTSMTASRETELRGDTGLTHLGRVRTWSSGLFRIDAPTVALARARVETRLTTAGIDFRFVHAEIERTDSRPR